MIRSICVPNPWNRDAYPGPKLVQPERRRNVVSRSPHCTSGCCDVELAKYSNMFQLRLDTYTCNGVDFGRGTLVTETTEHSDPPEGHESQHIHIPLREY